MSMVQVCDKVTLKWTPNSLMDRRQGEEEVRIFVFNLKMVIMTIIIQVREGEVGWQQAVVISLESILYLHCHQVMMMVIIIIIKFDELMIMMMTLF